MPEAKAGFDVQAALVGTAMQLRLVHPGQEVPLHVPATANVKDPDNSAHCAYPSCQRWVRPPGIAARASEAPCARPWVSSV